MVKSRKSEKMKNIFSVDQRKNPLFKKSKAFQLDKSWRKSRKDEEYKVITYQIPVPLGDCSAHFVLDKSRKVIKAFFMDGGKSEKSLKASTAINSALQVIDSQLGANWQFDSWVVTHWDSDHYQGLLELFEEHNSEPKRPGGLSYFAPIRFLFCGGSPLGVSQNLQAALTNMKFSIDEARVMENMIGMDLFTGDSLFNAYTGDLYTDVENKILPRFCVVGANGYGVCNATRYKSDPSPNETSVLAIVYWPATGRCSYFTGGDGYPDVESKSVIPFLEAEKVMKGPVKVLKLDHHGSSGELLGRSKTSITEDIVTGLLPSRVIVTPGEQYGHPSWDVVAFLYDYHRTCRSHDSKTPSDFLYTTRSPYWAQKRLPSGKDVNVTKIKRMVEIFDKWKEDSTPVIVHSWDEWKASFGRSERKGSRDIEDEDFLPESAIEFSSEDVLWLDDIGQKAEEKLFQAFKEEIVELAKNDPNAVFGSMRKRPTNISEDMFKNPQWRQLFAKEKYQSYDQYRKLLKNTISSSGEEVALSNEETPAALGLEALFSRQEERTAWADSMRLLWNDISCQTVNQDTDQEAWYILKLTSTAKEVTDGTIEIFDLKGNIAERLDSLLHGAETRSFTKEQGFGEKDFHELKLPPNEAQKFKIYLKKRLQERLNNLEKEKRDAVRAKPSGRIRRDVVAYEKNVQRLVQLIEEVKKDLEKNK